MIIEKERNGFINIVIALASLVLVIIPWLGIVVGLLNIRSLVKNREQAKWIILFDLALVMTIASCIICFLQALSILLLS